MGRTQIYLGAEEIALLARQSRQSGASRSELIRRAVQATYGRGAAPSRVEALHATSGLWRDHTIDSAGYVDSLRGDLNERLERLGL